MKSFGKIALLLLPVLAVTLAITLGCSSADDEAKKAAGEEKGKEAKKAAGGEEPNKETRKIPLDSVYSTYRQKGLKEASDAFRAQPDGIKQYVEPYGAALAEIRREFRAGASNVFLVREDDITGVVYATLEVFTRRRRVDKPVSADSRSKSENYWLAVFFGVDSSSRPWLVKSVHVEGKQTRINYTKVTSEEIVLNERLFFVWVPLGKLEAATYTLELFDQDQQEVTLSRRVKVTAK